jgi:serine/threonine-protein kinase RsbW
VNDVAETTRTFRADAAVLADVRSFLRDRAAQAGLSEATSDDLLLAVSEACANAILHSGSDTFDLTWTMADEAVEVEVRDHGTFRRRVRMPHVEGPGGFGIPLMMALTDRVDIREGTPDRPGTRVKLIKRRSS